MTLQRLAEHLARSTRKRGMFTGGKPVDPLTAVVVVERMRALLAAIGTGDYPPTIKGDVGRQVGWDAAIAMMIALIDDETAE